MRYFGEGDDSVPRDDLATSPNMPESGEMIGVQWLPSAASSDFSSRSERLYPLIISLELERM